MAHFHELSAVNLRGQTVPMQHYAGQVVLVVNTATHCGLTPQLSGLEQLYQRFKADGLVVLGFPCNQFGRQAPGSAQDIAAFCQINHGVSFPMWAKVDVNGPQAHPVFQLLTHALPGWFGPAVRWNFTKFLVGRDGQPLRRFSPFTPPAKLESAIRAALSSAPTHAP